MQPIQMVNNVRDLELFWITGFGADKSMPVESFFS